MLWFFENGSQRLEIETRYDSATGEFVAIVVWPSGEKLVERFRDAPAFRARLQTLEAQLIRDQFQQIGGPRFDSDNYN